MTSRTEIIKQLKNALERNILLSEEEKADFLKKVPLLPDLLLSKALSAIEEKNGQTDHYLTYALYHDPEQKHLKQLRSQVKTSKKQAIEIYDKSNQTSADETLQNELKNIQ